DWFGATRFSSGMEERRQSLDVTPSTVLEVFHHGEPIFSYSGPGNYCCVHDLSDLAVPVASWSVAWNRKGVGCFTFNYGEGKVLWCAMEHHPNFPQVQELFLAGVRWVTNGPLVSAR